METIENRIRGILLTLISRLEQPCLKKDDLDSIQFQLDNLHEIVVKANDLYDLNPIVIDLIGKAKHCIHIVNEDINEGYLSPLILTGIRGRPAFNIPKCQLEFYLSHGFSTEKISEMIGVSSRTIKRRMKDYGLEIGQLYSDVTDERLDNVILQKMKDFPNCGYRRMNGLLLADGLRVQERKLRKAMQRVDPEGVLLRMIQLQLVHRRKYQVHGPLSLWHIDGHHKLIRYSTVFQ